MNIKEGFCHCGCGKRTSMVLHTRTKQGLSIGNYYRYAISHKGLFIPTGTLKISDRDRVLVRVNGRWKDNATYIAEKVLKRLLKSPEMVHHLDGNHLNNKNNNLLVCTKSYHCHIHSTMANRTADGKFA